LTKHPFLPIKQKALSGVGNLNASGCQRAEDLVKEYFAIKVKKPFFRWVWVFLTTRVKFGWSRWSWG